MNTFRFPDAAMELSCVRCGHPLAGHMDTGGHFLPGFADDPEHGCHFDWYDEPDMPDGCKCPGFECPKVRVD